MGEMTQEEALRTAYELVSQELKEVEARCTVLGQYINERDGRGSRAPSWTEAFQELRALHDHRSALMRRHSLIGEALDCAVGERPATVPLTPSPARAAIRTQQQIQVRRRRR